MIDEQLIRTWAMLMFCIYILVWIHSIVMQRNNKTYFYSLRETPAVKHSLRILLISSMTGLLLFALNPAWMNWSQLNLPASLRWFGIATGLLALTILGWSIRACGKYFVSPLRFQNNDLLFTSGPYKWVRHPLCSVNMLLVVSSFLVTANWFIGLCGVLGSLIAIIIRTPMEEKILMEKFGTDYIMYKHRTGRFLPRFETLPNFSFKR